VNTERIARGWDLIAEGAAEIALAYRAIEQPAAGVGTPPPARASAPAGSRIAGPDDDLPPLYDEEDEPGGSIVGRNVQDQHVANVLGQCPTHQKPWTIKPSGVSKAGKPYSAFWKCGEKDESTRSGYCDKKPVKAWQDANQLPAAA
jgi:hypothetical protein